jgi:DNA-binding transcriptional LysR family regulator
MADRIVDPRLFRYALASAEHGSFRRAAEALGVRPSSVSKAIGNLEHRVGTALFRRSHSGVHATAAGERFLTEVSLGFDHFRRAMLDVDAARRAEKRKIVVALSVPFLLVGSILARFHREHRSISLELVAATCEASAAMLQEGGADIAFISECPNDDSLQLLHLKDEQMLAVLPISHRLSSASEVRLDQLAAERLILSAGGLGPKVATFLTRQLAPSGFELTPQIHRLEIADILEMVVHGFGVTITVGRPAITEDDLILVPLAGVAPIPIRAAWMEAHTDVALRQLQSIARRLALERSVGEP